MDPQSVSNGKLKQRGGDAYPFTFFIYVIAYVHKTALLYDGPHYWLVFFSNLLTFNIIFK